MELSDRIRKIRKSNHLTQVDFGKKLHVSPQVVSNWERGYTIPSGKDLENIALTFKVNPIEFKNVRNDNINRNEKDIAKRLEKIKKDLEEAKDSDGYMLMGNPISEEAKQTIIDATEFAIRQSNRINKKYIPRKYRSKE